MLNTEYILEAIRPYLTKDKKLRESDFNRLFSTLTRQEQYEIIKILIDKDIDYVDDDESDFSVMDDQHVNNMVVQLTGEEKKNARLALASFLKVKLVSGSVFSA